MCVNECIHFESTKTDFLLLFSLLFAYEIDMKMEEAKIHADDAIMDFGNFELDSNYADGNEVGVVAASTSSIAAEMASEATNEIKLRENHDPKKSQKKKSTRVKSQNVTAKAKAKANRFECDQCDYANAFQSKIKRHAQTHSAESLFQCENCDARYRTESSLKNHLLQVHNIIYL